MNATLNIGQTIGDYRVEEFVKASNENGGETYFVSGRDGMKALMKLYAVETKAHTVECGSAALLPQHLGFVPMVANGTIEHNGSSYQYIVRDFIEGKRTGHRTKCIM